MTEADAGAAAATPPNDAAPNNPTTEAKAPSPGPSPFEGLPDDLKGVPERKGWKSVADAVKAYDNAERAIGDKIAMPKAGDEEALKAHLVKLGAPEDGKYDLKIEEGIPVDEGLKSTFEQTAAEIGLLPHQAQKLLDMWNGAAKAAQAEAVKTAEAKDAAKEAALEGLRKEWGPDQFEAQMTLATKAAAYGDFPDDLLTALEDTLPGGTKSFIECMARIGALGTEDQFGQGTGGQPPASAKSLADRLYDKTPSP